MHGSGERGCKAAFQAGLRRYERLLVSVPRTSESPQVGMRRRFSSSDAMRSSRITGWLAPPAAVALALIIGGGSARADVCVVVNPVLELGCRDGQGAPAPGTAQSARAPDESEPVRRSSTEPRYDSRRLAITFKRRTSTATIRAVIARRAGDKGRSARARQAGDGSRAQPAVAQEHVRCERTRECADPRPAPFHRARIAALRCTRPGPAHNGRSHPGTPDYLDPLLVSAVAVHVTAAAPC